MGRMSNKKKEELRNKKKLIIGSSVVLILVLVFLVVKIISLLWYSVLVEDIDLQDNIINIKSIKSNGEYSFDDMYFSSIDGFIADEEMLKKYDFCKWYYLDGDREKEMFTFGKMLGDDIFDYSRVEDETDDLMEKYNINNHVQLLDYYFEHKDDNLHIFSSFDKIKINYLADYYFLNNNLSDEVYKITGDLNGYLYKSSKSYNVILGYEDDVYSLTFANRSRTEGFFNTEKVIDILETIYFE